jgi:hypothetical protein
MRAGQGGKIEWTLAVAAGFAALFGLYMAGMVVYAIYGAPR